MWASNRRTLLHQRFDTARLVARAKYSILPATAKPSSRTQNGKHRAESALYLLACDCVCAADGRTVGVIRQCRLFFKEEAQWGSITPGHQADLLILDGIRLLRSPIRAALRT